MSSLPAFLDQISAITVTDVVPFGGRPFEVRGHVFVGCGTWPDPGLTLPTDHLVLNNKRAGSRFQHKFPSVIKLLEAPPPGLLESWETWADRPLMPAQALQRITLVAEDASPDSVFGILLLLGRLAGLEPHQLPSGWIEAVDEWERTGVADEPQRSWCALASALAHARFPVGSQPSAEVLAAAWTDLLRFAAACIAAHVSPRAMPDLRSIKEWRDARSALHQEERVYLDWLQQATIAQLSLPLSFSPDRRLLLDSLFITEYQPTGSAKVFYRNDTARSPLGKGFSLAAHYRPAERGTGNDITIAVDPRIGVNLRDLWSELERRENEAWANAGETRLDCEPRWPDRADCRWNEPWFINDDGTLIGAPHKLATDQFGTKLSWQDILAAIWAVYNPLLDVKVCRIGSDHPIPLLQLTPEATARDGAESASVDHGKRLLCASWPRSPTPTQGAGPRALGQAPIVPRMIAGMIGREAPTDYLSLESLPTGNSWQQLALGGGFAIVTQKGLFALDDWTHQQLDFASLRSAFQDAAALNHNLRRLELDALRPLLDRVVALLDNDHRPKRSTKAPSGGDIDRLLPALARIGAELAKLRASHATPHYHPDARVVHDALDRQWGLTRRLTAIDAEVRALETSLRSFSELRIARISRFVAIHGFALLLAATFADALAKFVWSMLAWSIRGLPEHMPEWPPFVAFMVGTAVLSLLFRWGLSRQDPLRDN